MNPQADTVIWPHEQAEIYRAFDRIFDCRRHGWANLQSMHLNLSFHGDAEFARLHAAIRTILPLLPALAASSPYLDGKFSGYLDGRMEVYRTNSAKVPSIAGLVIPEPVFSEADYERTIYEPIRRDIETLDPDGTLEAVWLNARGAIARFDRGAIEIRVLDTQECPEADMAIAELVIGVLRQLCDEIHSTTETQKALPTNALTQTLQRCIRDAERAELTDGPWLQALGLKPEAITAAQVWSVLASRIDVSEKSQRAIETILRHGPLARRMLTFAGERPDRPALKRLAEALCDCLRSGNFFIV